MKAVLQNFKTGKLAVEMVPPPILKPDGVLVANAASLISAGTEKSAIKLAKKNAFQKARARPDLVQKVVRKIGKDGLFSTAQTVKNLVNAPLPLGYSCAGTVTEVGNRVSDIMPSRRVACAGFGYANHAEMVYVPRNLCVPVPDNVDFEQASFVTVGAIALQGVRQANLTLGETVVIVGMGLIGQLVAQICLASGCRVLCVDKDNLKLEIAKTISQSLEIISAEADVKAEVLNKTFGRGADAVLIAASTKSSEPVALAAEISRDRGRVVAIGDIGLNIPRRAYYEKEITLLQSRSYGPGRYDPQYEEKGLDYPIGYVRWTENRNMEAFIDLVSNGRIDINPLITQRYAIAQAEQAYEQLLENNAKPAIGIILEYEQKRKQPNQIALRQESRPRAKSGTAVSVGVIGAGQFAQSNLLPALKKTGGVNLKAFATSAGFTSLNVARKYNAQFCTSDYREILSDPDIDAVLIAARHDTHAAMVIDALNAGKHCFVEKPLAMNEEELEEIINAHEKSSGTLLVGFNRRFSPMASRLRDVFGGEKLVMQYRINAGRVPRKHWQQDNEIGGGRIIGEVCHFIDLMQFIANAEPVSISAVAMRDVDDQSDPDNVLVTLSFSDGSIGTITFTSVGDPNFPKERLEVFGGRCTGIIDNWRRLAISGNKQKINHRALLQAEKGIKPEMAAFINGVRSGISPIPFASLVHTTKATFAIKQSLRKGCAISIQ